MIIGVTGSSGAGKSTVCEFLENNYKVKIINADKISKKLSKKGTSYVIEIIEKFWIKFLFVIRENGVIASHPWIWQAKNPISIATIQI